MAFAGLVGQLSGLRGGQGAPTGRRRFGGTTRGDRSVAPISGRVQQRTPIPEQSQVVEETPKTTLPPALAETQISEQNQPIDEDMDVQRAIQEGAQQLSQRRGRNLGKNQFLAYLRSRDRNPRR